MSQSYQACSPTYHSLWNHLIYLNLIESQLFIEELLTRIRYQLSTLNNNTEEISKGSGRDFSKFQVHTLIWLEADTIPAFGNIFLFFTQGL